MTRDPNNIELTGEILQALPNTMYRIQLQDGRLILASPAGRMRRGFIRILPGDRVKVEMTPYDKERGRIVYKL